jgi:sucrose phosphorylase
LTEGEIDNLVNKIGKCGGLISYKSNANGTQSPYEANINYLDALSTAGEPIEMTIKRFLSAHAVLFSLAGLPAIYFHSLFGSRGWSEGAVRTGRNRSINREKLKLKQLQSQLEEKGLLRAQVFNGLSKLIKARARHPAFSPFGKQRVQEIDARVFAVLRIDPATEKSVLCLHNVTSEPVLIKMNPLLTSIKPKDELSDLITGTRYPPGKASSLSLSPYQCVWLTERTGSGEQDHQILDQPQ